MANTEKEFLEWKVDFLKNQAEMLNAPLEAGHVPDEEIELFETDIRNIKVWIKELKGKKIESTKKNLKWKSNFLEEQLKNVNMNLEGDWTTDEHREFLQEDARNITAWIKELKNGQNRQK